MKYDKNLQKAIDLSVLLSDLDAPTLQMVAEQLVMRDHRKADALEFAINTELRELLMSYGFSAKINQY